jgi:hypothetical protein
LTSDRCGVAAAQLAKARAAQRDANDRNQRRRDRLHWLVSTQQRSHTACGNPRAIISK